MDFRNVHSERLGIRFPEIVPVVAILTGLLGTHFAALAFPSLLDRR
jgi:hypothetical protein